MGETEISEEITDDMWASIRGVINYIGHAAQPARVSADIIKPGRIRIQTMGRGGGYFQWVKAAKSLIT